MEDWKEWLQEHWKVVVVVMSALLIVIGFFVFRARPEESSSTALETVEALQSLDSSNANEEKEAEAIDATFYVDIKGAVKKPGMYAVQLDMRVFDVIQQAGGFCEDADENQVNLAMKLADQMVIYVPKVGEAAQETQVAGELPTTLNDPVAKEEGKINLNTADVTELQQLNGIGQKKAEAIIDYREQNGSFQSIEDITKVSGIGQQTFQKLKEHLSV